MGKAAEIDLQPLEPVLAEYAAKPGSLITILQHTQDIYGYLPQLQPVGRYLIMLCQGTACHVNGAESISAIISEELGIADGQTTADGLFTLKHVACLGCCSLAPAMMINGEVYGNLTADSVRGVLKELRAKEAE